MNKYSWWKYLIIILVIVPGIFYSIPNLFGKDPGVQILGTRAAHVTESTLARMNAILAAAEITPIAYSLDETGASFRFANTDVQLKAKDLLQQELGDRKYTVALSLLPATPNWLIRMGGEPMNLGLDLRGGVHFLVEVDLASAYERTQERYQSDMRTTLREAKARHQGVRRLPNGKIEIRFKTSELREKGRNVIDRELPGLQVVEIEREDKFYLNATLSQQNRDEIAKFAIQQNMTALRNRIDELGVAEPVVQQQGARRIVIQLPGVQDPAKAKAILGRTATLEMMMVDEAHDPDNQNRSSVPPGTKVFTHRNGRKILLKKRVIYSGDNIVDAAAGFDQQTGGPVVHITLDARGAAINQRVTGANIKKRMAVLYIETVIETKKAEDGSPVLDDKGREVKIKRRIEEVITAPVIQDQLGKRFQITGLDDTTEAQDLALLLRAGSLAAPIEFVEERTVGPSLGRDNIEQGMNSVMIGFILVLIFMVVYYRLFGWVANLALFLNLVLIVSVLSLVQATLTLPGVAGIVLTVGMAVDANVLIFERIREELRAGNSPQASIHVGYDKALSTIVDANITTLIAALVLFNFGTGPIKGFAVTLSIGILTSMFTAIMGTRGVINLVYGSRRVSRLSI